MLPVPHGMYGKKSPFYLEKGEVFLEGPLMRRNDLRFCSMEQVHGERVGVVDSDSSSFLFETDALITQEKSTVLLIKTADCLPIFFYDPVTQTAGVVHAGWKGVLKDIHTKTIQQMEEIFHVNPKNLMVAVGPGIRSCHFEMSDPSPFQKKYGNDSSILFSQNSKEFVDLFAAVEKDMRDVGVVNIDTSSASCTVCEQEQVYSYRMGALPQERNVSFLFLG